MDAAPVIQLSDLDLFADCTKGELRTIESLTTYLHLPKDRVLVTEGRPAREFIVIARGTARLSRHAGGDGVDLSDVGQGEFIGERELLTGAPQAVTATAATDLHVLVSSASEFHSILQVAPSVADKVRRAFAAEPADLDTAA
jgi:CRP-like cAMP-binding protein